MEETPSASSPEEASLNPLERLALARKKQQWVSWANQQYTAMKNARIPYERQWYLNLAFTNGKQYVSPVMVPGGGFKLTAPRSAPWQVRLVINKIRLAVRKEAANLTSNRPIPVVVPSTSEDEDFAAARVAEKLTKAYFAHDSFDEVLRDWVWWGVVTANSYIKAYYNPDALDHMSMMEVPKGPDGQQLIPGPPVVPAHGKFVCESVSPFHVYVPDLLAKSVEDQPYIIQVMTKTPEWVFKSFGFKASPDSRSHNTIMESGVLSPVGATNETMDTVLVKEVWIKPGAHVDFPQGGLLTIINDRIVQMRREWPLPYPEYPFYKYQGIPTGAYYDDSVVTDLIPIQKEYNKTKSQMIEIKNTIMRPKLLYPEGSINPRKINSDPNQSIPYKPGYGNPPMFMNPPEVPASMHVELDRLNADFDDLSSQHEIARGGTPNSQISSGTAIAFLQEQDNSTLAYQVSGIEHAVARIGRHFLTSIAAYWDGQRIVRVVGRENELESIHWQQNKLRGNNDVRVMSGSALPYSKAAKTAQVTEFMQMGYLDPSVGFELLEMGGLEKAVDDMLVDKRAAQRENLKLSKADPMMIQQMLSPPVGPDGQPITVPGPDGQPIPIDPMTGQPWQPQPPLPVNSWDNHEAHIHYHNQYRKTQEFELLPEPIKQAFEMHVQMHEYALFSMQNGIAGPLGPSTEGEAVAGEEEEAGQSEGEAETPV